MKETQNVFVDLLEQLVNAGGIYVVATLRSDFYAHYLALEQLVELTKSEGRFELGRPDRTELGAMIRGPAQAAGLTFEIGSPTKAARTKNRAEDASEPIDKAPRLESQALDEALRDEAVGHPESLPLLEHALDQLYEAQVKRGDDCLRWEDYLKMGRLEGALAMHAEAVFQKLRAHEQETFSGVMAQLVTIARGGKEIANRRTAFYHDLCGSDQQPEKAGAKTLVDTFIRNRLLVADRGPTNEVVVTVVHEALLQRWDRARTWIDQNREMLHRRDRLDASLKLYQERGRSKTDLLPEGLALDEGEILLRDFSSSLSQEQADYVRISMAEQHRQRNRRNLIWNSALALFAALALGAGLQWWRAEAERRTAEHAVALQQQLEEASWASFNQAERLLTQTRPDWRQAIALFGRAIQFNLRNQVASERFFNELILNREQVPNLVLNLHHAESVTSAKFSPDGSRILTASDDKTAKLWDAATGKLLASFNHDGIVRSAVFNPDGTRVLTASWDKTARLWDAGSGKPLVTFNHDEVVTSAAMSPDGSRILTGSRDKTAKLWDAGSGKLLATFNHDGWVTSGVFSPDGTRILTSSVQIAKLWDAASGKLVGSFPHAATVTSGVFSPDGSRVLTAGWDKTARLWEVGSGGPMATLNHDGAVDSAAFSPDGSRCLTAGRDKTAKLWDTGTAKLAAMLKHNDWVTCVAFSPDGSRILTASRDKTAKLWDTGTAKLLASFNHDGMVRSAAFSPDGTRILTASAQTATLWDVASGTLLDSFNHAAAIDSAAFSPDGTRILTASRIDKTAKLWDAASRKSLATLNQSDWLQSAAFSPDGSRVLTTSSDKTAKLWDTASGKLLATFKHDGWVASGVFSPDGSRALTTSSDKTAKLWEVATGRSLAKIVAQSSTGAITSEMSLVRRRINLLSEIASRYELAADGSLTDISVERCQELRQQLLADGDGGMGQFWRRYLGPPGTR